MENKEEITLGDVVEISRCQAQRVALPDSARVDWPQTALSKDTIWNAQLQEWTLWEDRRDMEKKILARGVFKVWEIGFNDLHERSFFAPRRGKSLVLAQMRKSNAARMMLRENDILLNFQGAGDKVGMFGFVYAKPEPSIPLRNLCILRPDAEKINPVWLFQRLRQLDVYAYLREKAVKSGKTSSIPLEAVRSLRFAKPLDYEVECIQRMHDRILKQMEIVEKAQYAIYEAGMNILEIYSGGIDPLMRKDEKDLRKEQDWEETLNANPELQKELEEDIENMIQNQRIPADVLRMHEEARK